MSKLSVALVGWRGMVGSVLVQRMQEEGDFDKFDVTYFSTSQAGRAGPDGASLADAFSVEVLAGYDVVITCQGSGYTEKMHTQLRSSGWQGYWIDAASKLRMNTNAVIILDPVNMHVIEQALDDGVKDLIGANCTVSTMMMGLTGLFDNDVIEWISSMTYQAASGAGARNMKELLMQMHHLGEAAHEMIMDPSASILDIDRAVSEKLASDSLPLEHWPVPLAANAIPWIDTAVGDGMSREEWKGMVETNKIMGGESNILVDGTCVRIGAMRSHAHGLTIKLKKDIPLDEIADMIASSHEWVNLVPNTPEESVKHLTPVSASGSLMLVLAD